MNLYELFVFVKALSRDAYIHMGVIGMLLPRGSSTLTPFECRLNILVYHSSRVGECRTSTLDPEIPDDLIRSFRSSKAMFSSQC